MSRATHFQLRQQLLRTPNSESETMTGNMTVEDAVRFVGFAHARGETKLVARRVRWCRRELADALLDEFDAAVRQQFGQ